MDETKLVNCFKGKRDFCHVETGNVFGEDLVLDQHGHQVTTGKELHEHVQEGGVLERGVQLDEPRTVGVCENVALGANVGQLVLFELRKGSVSEAAVESSERCTKKSEREMCNYHFSLDQ